MNREPKIFDKDFNKKYRIRWATPSKVDMHKQKGYVVVDESMLKNAKESFEFVHRKDGAYQDEGGHILMARTYEVAVNHLKEMAKLNEDNGAKLAEEAHEIEEDFHDRQKVKKRITINK